MHVHIQRNKLHGYKNVAAKISVLYLICISPIKKYMF